VQKKRKAEYCSEKMEGFMDTSETTAKLFDALAKAQGAIKGAAKDSNNPHFKSKYADLASVWEACREALSKNGIAIVQMPGQCAANMIELTTRLGHSSGEWMQETMTIPLGKVDAQSVGSALTYARRYSLAAFVGVAPDDDDGNAATASAPNEGQLRNPSNTTVRNQPEKLKGPIKTRAEARTRYGEIVRELHACADEDMLAAYLASEYDVLNQFMDELPSAWNGDGSETFLGLEREISNAQDRVQQVAAE
jgi:uncharacterized protein YukE